MSLEQQVNINIVCSKKRLGANVVNLGDLVFELPEMHFKKGLQLSTDFNTKEPDGNHQLLVTFSGPDNSVSEDNQAFMNAVGGVTLAAKQYMLRPEVQRDIKRPLQEHDLSALTMLKKRKNEFGIVIQDDVPYMVVKLYNRVYDNKQVTAAVYAPNGNIVSLDTIIDKPCTLNCKIKFESLFVDKTRVTIKYSIMQVNIIGFQTTVRSLASSRKRARSGEGASLLSEDLPIAQYEEEEEVDEEDL